MAFAIPKLQYKNVDTIGDTTLGDGTIASIPDTSEIEVGMYVRGTGIPAGATVGVVTSASITLADSVVATSSNAAEDYYFGWEIEFDYPPIEPGGEALDTKATVTESLSGIKQVSINNIEGNRKLNFSFLSPAIYTKVDTFLKTSGLLGDSFRYFESKTVDSYVEYELDSLKVASKKIAPRGVDTYVWEVSLTFRRTL